MVSIAPLFLVACFVVFGGLVALGLIVRSRQRTRTQSRTIGIAAVAGVVALVLVIGGAFAVVRIQRVLTPKSLAEHRVDVGPGTLRELVVSPRGDEFAVATDRGAVQLRSVEDGEVRLRLEIPANDEIHLAYSGDGTLLAAGGDEGVHVWDVTSGQERARIPRPGGDVLAVALSADGTRAVLLDATHVWTVDLAEPTTRRLLRAGHFQPPANLRFGPGGSWIAGWESYRNRPLVLFGATGGEDVRTIGRRVTTVAFTPDGRTVLVHERGGIGELVRYDTGTGRPIGEAVSHGPSGSPPIALSPDAGRVAAADDRTGVHVWDTSDGRELGDPLKLGDPPLPLPVTALAFTADSLLVGYFDRVEIFATP